LRAVPIMLIQNNDYKHRDPR